MSTSYQSGYDYEPSEGAYLSLKNAGDKVRVRIMGYPIVFKETFKLDDGGVRTAMRAAWPVLHKTQSSDGTIKKEPKHFRGSESVYKDIRKLCVDSDWGDPTMYDIEIERIGTGLSTKYTVTPKPNCKPLTEAETDMFTGYGWCEKPDWANEWLEAAYIKPTDED